MKSVEAELSVDSIAASSPGATREFPVDHAIPDFIRATPLATMDRKLPTEAVVERQAALELI